MQSKDPTERRNAWKAIGIFLLITIALSAVFDVIMARQGKMNLLMVAADYLRTGDVHSRLAVWFGWQWFP